MYTVDYTPHEYYKSYLMIKTKITTPSNTQDNDIYFFPFYWGTIDI